MIATDGNRRFQISAFDQIVNSLAHLSSLTIPKPTDACRQSLEVHAIAREAQPTIECAVIGKEFKRKVVSFADIVRVAGKRHPAKWSLPFAEERPNVFGYEARNLKGIDATGIQRLLAYVIPTVESHGPGAFQGEHCFNMPCHRLH